jgi:hypothetical protein
MAPPETGSNNIEEYWIYRDGEFLTYVSTTTYSDAGLSPDTQYCYTVLAYDEGGNKSDETEDVCATTLSDSTSPDAPEGLSLQVVSGSWETSTVDSAGDVGMYTSIAIHTNDSVHISYYYYDPADATKSKLKYAHYRPSWPAFTEGPEPAFIGYAKLFRRP